MPVTFPTEALSRLRHSWKSRSVLLPLAAGLVALLPWRAADVLRSWNIWSPPIAAAATEPATTPTAAPVPAATLARIDRIGAADDGRAGESHLLAELSRRKAELAKREEVLDKRETQLAAAVLLARKQMAELTELRKSLDVLVAREATAAEADLSLLVGLYSNMKPPQAAAVLGKLDAPKAAAILARLDTRMAGPILASMDPSAALAITEELEQRRAELRR